MITSVFTEKLYSAVCETLFWIKLNVITVLHWNWFLLGLDFFETLIHFNFDTKCRECRLEFDIWFINQFSDMSNEICFYYWCCSERWIEEEKWRSYWNIKKYKNQMRTAFKEAVLSAEKY